VAVCVIGVFILVIGGLVDYFIHKCIHMDALHCVRYFCLSVLEETEKKC